MARSSSRVSEGDHQGRCEPEASPASVAEPKLTREFVGDPGGDPARGTPGERAVAAARGEESDLAHPEVGARLMAGSWRLGECERSVRGEHTVPGFATGQSRAARMPAPAYHVERSIVPR